MLGKTSNGGQSANGSTLVSQIVEHTKIEEHMEANVENLIVEHLLHTISITTNDRIPRIFFHCVDSQTRLTNKDTRVNKTVLVNADIQQSDYKLPNAGHSSWLHLAILNWMWPAVFREGQCEERMDDLTEVETCLILIIKTEWMI